MAEDGKPSITRGTLAPLSLPDYRYLLTSNTLWWLGMWMEFIVAGWLTLELTNSAWHVSLIGFYRSAPLMFVGLFSGPIGDRFGRIRLLRFSQGTNFIVLIVIVLLLWTDTLSFWHLAVGSFILGVGWAVDFPTRRALLPDLVGRSRIVDAVFLDSFFQNISRILGPFAAGFLVDTAGTSGCFAAMAGFSGIALLFTTRISRPDASQLKTSQASPAKLIAGGLAYISRSRLILSALLITAAMNFLIFPHKVLHPVFARDILGQGPVGLGLLGTAPGIGSVIALLVLNRMRRSIGNGPVYCLGSLLMSTTVVGFSASTSFYLSLALLTLFGVGQAWFGIMQSSIVLLRASDEMRGRAMGAVALAIGFGPLGKLTLGAISESLGAPLAVRLFGAVGAISVLSVAATMPAIVRDRQEAGDGEAEIPSKKGISVRELAGRRSER